MRVCQPPALCCRDSCVIISVLWSQLSCLKEATCICRFCRQTVKTWRASEKRQLGGIRITAFCLAFIIYKLWRHKRVKTFCFSNSYATLNKNNFCIFCACWLQILHLNYITNDHFPKQCSFKSNQCCISTKNIYTNTSDGLLFSSRFKVSPSRIFELCRHDVNPTAV